jgi:tryptophan synthase alpha chain
MKLEEKFRVLKNREEGALIGFITAGDPTAEYTPQIAKALIDGGVDMLELGLPFSDPIADGIAIQKASERSLSAGMNPDVYFEVAAGIKKVNKICLTYYNLVLQRGLEEFVNDCLFAEIEALIVPDLPVEESKQLLKLCSDYDLHLIFLVTPTTTEKRVVRILDVATGFIYIVSLLGVTGVREKVSDKIGDVMRRIKKFATDMGVNRDIDMNIPLAVGFGISKQEHVQQVCEIADGAIVGSAFVRIIESNLGVAVAHEHEYEYEHKIEMLKELKDFSYSLKKATKRRMHEDDNQF